MQFNVASALGPLALTASIYGAGPLLLWLRKGPISSKALKWLHIGYTAILAFAFSIYDFSNGYDISFSPAILWGSIFYWWNRSYFEKFNYPPVQPAITAQAAPASPDPVLSGPELPAVIPEKPVKKAAPRALVIGLVVALALSLAGNVWQAAGWSSDKKALASEIKEKDQSIASLKSANSSVKSELFDLQSYHFNTYYSTGYIVTGSTYFHRYDCPVVEAADTYQSHNTEFCKWLGYSGCPVCHSGISVSKIDKTPKQSAP